MTLSEQQLRRLSPGALRLYQRQLPQRLQEMGEMERNTLLEQLSRMPEFATMFQEPEPREKKWWDVPLGWMESVEKGAGTLLGAWFSPSIPGTEEMGWWKREKAEYEQWEAPSMGLGFNLPGWMGGEEATVGVKGTLELTPWFATAIASGGLAGLGRLAAVPGLGALAKFAQVGTKVLKPAIAIERAAAYPITKPLSMAAKKVLPRIADRTARIMTDLQPVDDAISIAMQPSRLRNLVNVEIAGKHPLKGMAEIIAGRTATADNPAALGLLGRAILHFEGANKATAAISTLNRMGASRKIFNLTDDGFMTIGKKQVHLNTVRTYPEKYIKNLTEPQKAWIKQARILEREKLALLERYGVEVPKLTFAEGGVYAGRRVVAKFTPEGELIDVAYIGRAQPGRPGALTAGEKARIFENIDDAIKEGYRYLPEEEALYYNTVGAYNRVADKEFADWFLARVPWRTTAGPEDLKAQVNLFRTGVASSRDSLKNAHKQLRKSAGEVERQQGVTFRATEEVGDLLEDVTTRQVLTKNTAYLRGKLIAEQRYANKLARTYAGAANRNEAAYAKVLETERRLATRLEELAEIEPIWRKALATARRAPFGGTTAPDIPAFAGKVFTSPEAKEWVNIVRKELNPQFNSALNAINQVNAVGRYFALAGDVSPFGIQLIFLAGAHPKIYGKAMGGFVRAMFDPLYHENFLAKHIATIQKHPGLILTKGGATEFTEAMARGGLLRKGPLKIMGKPLEPFMRGFESCLDTAGIYMAEAYEHLGTTALRRVQVDAFINEFRGLASTARIGISSSQRQLERAVILAPQYNRAIGSLMYDLTQGNLRGQLARRAMAKGTAAIMAMTVAVSMALGESEEEIIEHLNPLSTNFMTWDIAGQRVGPGSKVRSVLFTFGKMIKSPEDTAYHAGRFLQGNFSPFLRTSMDLITGKDYMGDPTRDGLPNLTKTVLGENLLPIWVQSVAFEGGDFASRVTRGMVEFGGMRGYPAGVYLEMQDLQDKLAQTQYGMLWEDLGKRPDGMALQMRITRESSELQELSEKLKEESSKWARGEQVVWNEYGRRVDQIQNVVTNELNQAAMQFEATRDGTTLRERVNQAYWLKAQMLDELLREEEFDIVKDTFDRPLTAEERAEMQPQKLLYRDYNELMYSDDMFNEFGEYRFDEADRRREMFIQQYGIEALNSVEMVIGERRADEPDAVKGLREAQKILKPYFDVETQIWAKYPPELKQISDQIKIIERTDKLRAKRMLFQYPQIVMARRIIALYKKQMKMRNPQMAFALDTYYRY